MTKDDDAENGCHCHFAKKQLKVLIPHSFFVFSLSLVVLHMLSLKEIK